ncbi:D-aspartate oxidase [Carcharodon carcharias]|uniref:D-aspartate oxidase n=1 Tax=Carcharodon carcharias TaxID=13397 RepID=UPI001B7E938D|nr:D-aspartate oxidase [Carcharodon carcharias]XP_041044381.1 D-aspartate oxidase [Carcharodon carcharias]
MDKIRIAVIGAGVVGLSTAICIAESIPGCSVTVIAEKFSPHTTSDVAAGILSPHFSPETPVDRQKRWFEDTFAHIFSIAQSAEAPVIGVQFLSGWEIFKEPPKERIPFWADSVLAFRIMNDSDLKRFPQVTFGWTYTTLLCECTYYLPWLEKRLKNAGGQLQAGKITDFWELDGKYDIIVNCSGIGARALTGDMKIYPVRGQIFKVHAPWLKHFVRLGNENTYIYPGISSVTLGGTRQKDDWQMSVDPCDSKAIFEACCAYEPSLKLARTLFEGVGLRPTRAVLRLEKEKLERDGRLMQLVHNYGHGGAGVSFHWGTAKEAAQLVQECAMELRCRPIHNKCKL